MATQIYITKEYRARIENEIMVNDKKRQIFRTPAQLESAIDRRILEIEAVWACMNGIYDYDDSRTEY